MNEIKTTTNLWVAATKNGWVLCYGNPNAHLDYHFTDFGFSYGRHIVYGERRVDVMHHIRRWNKQCGSKKDWKCKAVKVAITIETIKKGETDEQ